MFKNFILLFVMYFMLMSLSAQSVIGKWKTIDDETGEEKSIVEIYEVEGKIYGKILKVINAKRKNPLCDKCEGKNKDKPIIGMVIIDGLKKDDDVYEGGNILNPTNGKVYKCRLKIEDDKDTLQVRGYIAFFYKTQYWKRVSE
ncbi:DUF2147 domain-containing protein [Winogradskyella echinorum]|uniref:DUF2147 domain-containing protein n=1 Tax=Winogradskyella echinorum TaxID=538189 RepID=A0ABR6Y1X7_9FLAO|nr:DUF2147 domain-containing protein [Winogradskyella echinorum]MBC3846746.1 DUF2147 domain-containing protein [Winogradskyella echinorum]MBC5751094.1 DUF2147 domain-containing protein [Winogradskyella echinorum]